MEDCKYTL